MCSGNPRARLPLHTYRPYIYAILHTGHTDMPYIQAIHTYESYIHVIHTYMPYIQAMQTCHTYRLYKLTYKSYIHTCHTYSLYTNRIHTHIPYIQTIHTSHTHMPYIQVIYIHTCHAYRLPMFQVVQVAQLFQIHFVLALRSGPLRVYRIRP